MKIYLLLFSIQFIILPVNSQTLPLVINTWGFTDATREAWDAVYQRNLSSIDSVVLGCSVCEREQCDGTVGYGGSPDENGETTLDAMIMDGKTMNMGAVAALRNVKDVIALAKHVLLYTKHSMLVGSQATEFAEMQGFKTEPLSTNTSKDMWRSWRENNCQPNYWVNVKPNPEASCGPYKPITENDIDVKSHSLKEYSVIGYGKYNHDTIGMIVIDRAGNIASGTSTNGARHKIPGRVGDSPIPGAGSYADNEVGAAAATGDGDVLMRFLPSFLAVELMRQGHTPKEAGKIALSRITKHYSEFMGAIVVADKNGNYGAACHGIDEFPFSVYNLASNHVQLIKIGCK
uniref:N(4)-(beta-N-acetylglucosaminyl)-L-asparaginase n=1 Tax=Culicoides sonorensis TaxID=179676 RepID=A0A336MN77_CULSO